MTINYLRQMANQYIKEGFSTTVDVGQEPSQMPLLTIESGIQQIVLDSFITYLGDEAVSSKMGELLEESSKKRISQELLN